MRVDRARFYEENFSFTPEERANLGTAVWGDRIPEEALYGYDYNEINRSAFAMQGDFIQLDQTGPVRSFREIYQRQGHVSVLDAGCGTGHQLWSLVDNAEGYGINWDKVAADAVSKEDFSLLADQWRPRAAIMTGDINYHVGDLTQMELPEKAYDLVYAYELLAHIERPQHIVRSIWHALRLEGRAYFNLPGERQTELADIIGEIKTKGGEVLSMDCRPPLFVREMARQGYKVPTRQIYRIDKPAA